MPEREHHYLVDVVWTGNNGTGTSGYRDYARSHETRAEGKPSVPGSSDPSFRGEPDRWSPEELLVSSLSSCHMLWFLHLCADAGIVVTEYVDSAEGIMAETAAGGGEFTAVILRPLVSLANGVDEHQAEELHFAAHERCFIANSVKFQVKCEPKIKVA